MGVLLSDLEEIVTPDLLHGPESYRRTQLWRLIRVIKGQQEESDLPPNGWHDLWCIDCSETADPFQGTLEQAGEKFLSEGWDTVDAARNHAVCPSCIQREDESNWANQYQDNRGLLG